MPWTSQPPEPGAVDVTPDTRTVPERIEALIARTGISYSDLARTMGITRTTVHEVRKGHRPASKKFTAKFDVAEARILAARMGEGVLTRRGQALLLYAVGVETPPEDILVPNNRLLLRTANEGNEEAPTIEVSLVRPTKAAGVSAVIRALTHDECDQLLMTCFDSAHGTEAFIQNLSTTSYLFALKKCVEMILGPQWKQELQALVHDIDRRIAATIERLNAPQTEPEHTGTKAENPPAHTDPETFPTSEMPPDPFHR